MLNARISTGESYRGSLPGAALGSIPRNRDALPRRLALAFSLFGLAASWAHGATASSERPGIIVRFAAAGPHAVQECAETLFQQGREFAPRTADGSSSLDLIQEEIGVLEIRALFRRPDGQPLAEQAARLKSSLQSTSKSGAFQRAKISPAQLPDLSHIYRIETDPSVPLEEALTRYAGDPHVAWVQRDHTQQLDQLPNDPYLHSSGSWGQAFDDLWALRRIRGPEAWGVSQGEGVVVAVVDTGLDYEHPDISENVWTHPGEDLNGNGRVDASDWNGIDDDGNGFVDDLRGFDFANSVDTDGDGFYDGPEDISDADPFDDNGHGTHVAGTIAATANNGIGIAGVAPGARIMALKGFPAQGEGLDSLLWRAVLYAARNGAQVINNSWSCSPLCPRNPLAEDVVRTVHALGVVIVTSAGNRSTDVLINSPENMRETLTIASTGEDDQPSNTFTNHGWLVDVGAPGGGPSYDTSVYVARRNILSLRSSADTGSAPFALGPDYQRAAGTSMAAPHVSGVVALIRSAHPELEYESIRRLIRQGAVDLGPPGHDRWMGAGRLDALGALEAFPLPDLYAAIESPRSGSIFRPGSAPAVEFAGTARRSGGDRDNDRDDHEEDEDDDGEEEEEHEDGDEGDEEDDENPPAPMPSFVEIRGTAGGLDLLNFDLSYGLGSDPAVWHPITPNSTQEIRDGVLGIWDISDRDEGGYVIRLEVRGLNGRIYREFLPLSLERNQFTAISAAGPPALRPAISGRMVAWESRRDGETPAGKAGDTNLFASGIDSGAEWAIELAAGSQENVSIASSGSRRHRKRHSNTGPLLATWHGAPPEGGSKKAHGCWLDPELNLCPRFLVGPNSTSARAPVVASGHIFWIGLENGQQRLRACRPDPMGALCEEYDLGLGDGLRNFLRSDGSSLVWSRWENGRQGVGYCHVDPKTGACPARVLAESISPFSRVAHSGQLFAWTRFAPRQRDPLVICEVDPATGDCPPIEVASGVFDATPTLSGNRLVWDAAVGDQASDVFFCEFDSIRKRCPAQRLTAEITDQHESTLDGDQVVWRDEREGSSRIFGFELPRFSRLRDRRVYAGRELRIPLRVRRGLEKIPVSFGLEITVLEDGIDQLLNANALGIRLEGDGSGRAKLRWRPGREQTGSYVFTFSATTENGLVTRKTIRVEVQSRRNATRAHKRSSRKGKGF